MKTSSTKSFEPSKETDGVDTFVFDPKVMSKVEDFDGFSLFKYK